MGKLNLPKTGIVYVETAPIIYSVEKHADYWTLMQPVWQASQNGQIEIITSELTLLELLVAPLKQNNQTLVTAYERLLTATEVRLLPISVFVLREAANLRAQLNLKTPDAIHAASAHNCDLFLTNDANFRRVSSLNINVLKDFI